MRRLPLSTTTAHLFEQTQRLEADQGEAHVQLTFFSGAPLGAAAAVIVRLFAVSPCFHPHSNELM
jgi:hypothetical protein